MKKEMTIGTSAVPAPRVSAAERTRKLLNRVLPDECQIKTSQDAWYVSAIFCTCITCIFPPAVMAMAYCVTKAKKGGQK